MQPDPNDNSPQPANDTPVGNRSDSSAEAVANLTRQQIDDLYAKQPNPTVADANSANEQQTVYDRTHGSERTVDPKQWQHYHSAWQNYYQQYYEHYYTGEVNRAQKTLSEHAAKLQNSAILAQSLQPKSGQAPAAAADETISTDEAMYDLRAQLLSKVQTGATKVRKSRHFVPLIAALGVLLLFVFLQYNRVIIANVQAYVTPGSIDPQNIIVDPNASLKVSKEPRLIIPKINVDVPVDYGAKTDYNSQMAAMKNGVAYFGIAGADGKPGQLGNVPIAGHSSNDFIDTGNYKFVFALLERMQKGDVFYLNYEGTRYTYSVTKVSVVKPDDVSQLHTDGKKPMATLITCTPLGTATNRLLVFGEQISPDPASAAQASNSTEPENTTSMPGNSPTFLQRIFGGGRN